MFYYAIEFIEKVLYYYAEGMAINDISTMIGLSPEDINEILDHTIPYL